MAELPIINLQTEKTTPADADVILIEDSAASNVKKKLSWTNTKATLKTYFDTLYGSMANPMTTAGDIIYGGVSGAPTRLAKGTASQVLKMNAGATAPEWGAAAGGGDMVLADAQSVTGLKTFDKDKIAMKGTSTGTNIISVANTSATSYTNTLPAKDGTVAMTSDIVSQVEDNITDGHTTVAPSGNAVFDALALKAPLTAPTFATSITGSYLTASELLGTNASKEIISLPVITYPSLTELSYVKGLSSAIQTQLNAKQVTLTFGIANTNKVQIDAADVALNDYAKFTANGLLGRSYSEVLSDIGAAAVAQTFYIGTTQVAINRASAALSLALDTGSLTLSGSIADTTNRVLKGWFTNLEITNLPTVNGGTLATALSLGTMAAETATNYVAKSLYDANSILYATSDNTPLALAVGASTIVGRKSTGDIVALTATETRTILNVADGATAVSKASGAELDTATDDVKFATAKAIKDAHNVPSVVPGTSGNVLTSNGTDWTSAAAAGGGAWTLKAYTAAATSVSSLDLATDLCYKIIYKFVCTDAEAAQIQINGDTGSNYSFCYSGNDFAASANAVTGGNTGQTSFTPHSRALKCWSGEVLCTLVHNGTAARVMLKTDTSGWKTGTNEAYMSRFTAMCVNTNATNLTSIDLLVGGSASTMQIWVLKPAVA